MSTVQVVLGDNGIQKEMVEQSEELKRVNNAIKMQEQEFDKLQNKMRNLPYDFVRTKAKYELILQIALQIDLQIDFTNRLILVK